MYFVTSKRAGYVLFCTTANECAAIGLTDERLVQVLERDAANERWTVLAEWPADAYSHTDFMAALHHLDEPSRARQLLSSLPPSLRRDS
jgi:hypothetical protein